MRRNGYRDQRLHALYMNNSTYVCLIRLGALGWFREPDYTLMYVCVSDVQGLLSDERGEESARMVVNLGRFHWSSPRKAAALRMAGRAAAGLQDFDLWEGVLIALLFRTVSHDH